MLGKPTSTELRNNYRRMEVNKSFCEKIKILGGKWENDMCDKDMGALLI